MDDLVDEARDRFRTPGGVEAHAADGVAVATSSLEEESAAGDQAVVERVAH